ncbi:MAG: hypothetical protein ACKVHE_35035 [Planctomycetales bacterium]
MRRPAAIQFSLILLAVAASGFAADKVIESPFPGARPLPEDFVEPLFPHISEAEAAIYRKLNEKTSVAFDDLPLSDAIHSVSKSSGLPIILDVVAIEEAGLVVDEPVSLKVSNIPVRTILKLLLKDLELTYVVEDDVIKVTCLVVASIALTTGIFPVADLMTEKDKSWRQLANLIQGETDGLWERFDGSGGTVSISRATKSLIVRQTPDVLMDVQQLLTFLRAAKRIGEQRVNPLVKQDQGGGFGLGGKKGGRRKGGLGGPTGGNFF